jgi:hypothetical protein
MVAPVFTIHADGHTHVHHGAADDDASGADARIFTHDGARVDDGRHIEACGPRQLEHFEPQGALAHRGHAGIEFSAQRRQR